APRHSLRRPRLGSRRVLRRQLRLGHRRNRAAQRASARRIAALDWRGDHRAAAVLQQLLGAASILLVVAPGGADADRQAGVNGVSRLGRLASFGARWQRLVEFAPSGVRLRYGPYPRFTECRWNRRSPGLFSAGDMQSIVWRRRSPAASWGLRPPRAESPSRRSMHISSSPSPSPPSLFAHLPRNPPRLRTLRA